MKHIYLVIVVFIALFNSACTKQQALQPEQPGAKQSYRSVGVIKKIEADTGKITIDHEDIPGYMSAMEMTESVGDKAILASVKVGDKIDFEFDRVGEKITIMKMTKIAEVAVIDGAALYKTSCSECHGANGEGAKKGIPLTSGHALQHGEDEMLKRVKNGKDGKMPAFSTKLSTDEIASVVKFVRTEIQKNAHPEGHDEHHHH